MNNDDMNEMFKKAQYMIQNNQIPDDIKTIINNMQNSNNKNSNNDNNNNNINNNFTNNISTYNSSNSQNSNSSQNSNIPNIDIATMMKIQNIMSKMKNSENDDMSKLLLSLKPYLRDGKKDKVDEYIKLIKMGKMTQLFNNLGGDNN